jgi:hypothetical protein
VSGRDFRRAVAIVSARLRGDEAGERILTGECDCECRPLIAGLMLVAEESIKAIAIHDKITTGAAAEVLDLRLRTLPKDIE